MKDPKKSNIKVLNPPSGLPLCFCGPDLDAGPLPCLIYFALTGEESLGQDPYNQPVQFLNGKEIRVFSSTLPCHSLEDKHTEAMARWAEEIAKGNDILGDFISRSSENIGYLIRQGIAKESKIAASGLSRGGFAATQLAAASPHVSHVLGWAPVTDLAALQEFNKLAMLPQIAAYSPARSYPKLIHKKLRYYIGNQDTRTGTRECFEFVFQLASLAFENKVRSPTAELIISPSIGHKGHGTPPQIFREGAEWIAKELL